MLNFLPNGILDPMPILPGLTTTDPSQASEFLEALEKSSQRSIALFPTCLDTPQRRQLYDRLERIPGLTIPHVHIRTDMGDPELAYLVERFQTEVFNIHPRKTAHPYQPESDRFKKRIYIENSGGIPEEEELREYAGLCIDYSHWENGRLQGDPEYRNFEELTRKYPIGCCHLSAVQTDRKSSWGGWDHHHFRTTADQLFLAKYRDYLPPQWLSLELENTFTQQMEGKVFLETLFWE